MRSLVTNSVEVWLLGSSDVFPIAPIFSNSGLGDRRQAISKSDEFIKFKGY
jgi:hypothetical protein